MGGVKNKHAAVIMKLGINNISSFRYKSFWVDLVEERSSTYELLAVKLVRNFPVRVKVSQRARATDKGHRGSGGVCGCLHERQTQTARQRNMGDAS